MLPVTEWNPMFGKKFAEASTKYFQAVGNEAAELIEEGYHSEKAVQQAHTTIQRQRRYVHDCRKKALANVIPLLPAPRPA